jgi:hypothetical protein
VGAQGHRHRRQFQETCQAVKEKLIVVIHEEEQEIFAVPLKIRVAGFAGQFTSWVVVV